MNGYKNEKLLIISNNVLSTTRNNGKTIFSYVDCLPRENVAQLYFNSETPTIEGYSYYQITDKDIIKGVFAPRKRGRSVFAKPDATSMRGSSNRKVRRGNLERLARDLLWWKKWKSKKLLAWLDAFRPTTVFFVGGDAGFAYDIYRYIVKRYHAKSALYITDDYVMPRKKDSLIGRYRRKQIKQKVKNALKHTDTFFTVSNVMRKEYQAVFGRDSETIVNLAESYKLDLLEEESPCTTLIYAGSLYYGRDEVLGRIATILKKYNEQNPPKKACLNVYTNTEPSEESKKRFLVEGSSQYLGSLNKDALKLALNRADILVFAESFDEKQIEKTRYSLSTKVPEYLSVGKPILAVGPREIGSMEHLADAACCVNSNDELEERLISLLSDAALQGEFSYVASKKYHDHHDREKLQRAFVFNLFEKKIQEN